MDACGCSLTQAQVWERAVKAAGRDPSYDPKCKADGKVNPHGGPGASKGWMGY